MISSVAMPLFAILPTLIAGEQTGGGPHARRAATIACGPDRPVVSAGGTVSVRAWVAPDEFHALRYEWTAAVGRINGSGPRATWSLPGDDVASGPRRAEVHVSDEKGPVGACSLEVVVPPPRDLERGGPPVRETGRGLLTKDVKEKEGFGLYSYLLLGSRPGETNRQRYLDTITAYLDVIDEIAPLEEVGLAKSQLNLTYLPVVAAGPANDATALLADYDYARARGLLDHLPGGRRNGIYFVSSLQPLAGYSRGPLLVQDLSKIPTAPKDLIRWWVRAFLNQCAQERFWKAKTGEQLALRMRTIVAAVAEGIPEIRYSVKDWIAWLQ